MQQLFSEAIGKNNATLWEIREFVANNERKPLKMIFSFFALIKERARQNVVLEFGYFIGKLGRGNVCCLYKGSIELPSDMNGICYVHFENSVNEVWETILKELRATGYETKPEELGPNSILR